MFNNMKKNGNVLYYSNVSGTLPQTIDTSYRVNGNLRITGTVYVTPGTFAIDVNKEDYLDNPNITFDENAKIIIANGFSDLKVYNSKYVNSEGKNEGWSSEDVLQQ